MTVGNIQIEVVKKNIKNIHLAVYPPNGLVRLASPLDVQEETIKLFAISKLAWIKRQQRKYEKFERQSPRNYIERESHYFFGKRYLLKIIESDKPKKVEIKTKTYINLYARPNSTLNQREDILIEWYRAEIKKVVPELIRKWENKIGVSSNGWGVKQMKTKWGACNIEAKKIWLNLELAKKPVNCLEYIIVHELVHLLERNHNEVFFNYMNKFLPKWKLYKNELNRLPVSHEDWSY